jgi:hypothetical protein
LFNIKTLERKEVLKVELQTTGLCASKPETLEGRRRRRRRIFEEKKKRKSWGWGLN